MEGGYENKIRTRNNGALRHTVNTVGPVRVELVNAVPVLQERVQLRL